MNIGIPTITSSTLCIGLDIAWFGGSQNDPHSQHDFIAATTLGTISGKENVECTRVPLLDRDPDANVTAAALKELIMKYRGKVSRIILAVDAPLQALDRQLGKRQHVSKKGSLKRRACEDYLSCKRKSIDQVAGGANGWHPNIQPGAPIAHRVECLLKQLVDPFEVWTRELANHENLIIECFPAEAIWAAKRLSWFPSTLSAAKVKEYKNQKRKHLTAEQVTSLVGNVLLPFQNAGDPEHWDRVVNLVLEQILADNGWMKEDRYLGGKMLDDVVDSIICLVTAISYAHGNYHVWQDANHPDDGHIIGPGCLDKLLT